MSKALKKGAFYAPFLIVYFHKLLFSYQLFDLSTYQLFFALAKQAQKKEAFCVGLRNVKLFSFLVSV